MQRTTRGGSGMVGKKQRRTRVLWASRSYGYGHDLMYFAPLFRGFVAAFPDTSIAVDATFPVSRYPDLPLAPVLSHRVVDLDRKVAGVGYETTVGLPSPRLLGRLLQLRPGLVILIEFTPVALLGFLVAKISRARTLLLIESDPRFRGVAAGGRMEAVKRMVARRCDRVMTCNAAGGEFVRDRLGVAPDRVAVAPYLTSALERVPPDQVALRRDDGRVNILFLNSVTARKGVPELVEAVRRLDVAARAALLFHIVGDGAELEQIKARVATAALDASFLFYGRVPHGDTPRYYSGADLLISPTLADYRSLAGFEALSLGLPIMISRHDGAAAEVVEPGVNGWIFDPRDADGFTRTLAEVAAAPERLARFAAASRARAAAFAVPVVVGNIVAAARAALA